MLGARAVHVYNGLRSRPFAAAFAMLVFVGGLYGLLNIGLTADALAGYMPGWALGVLSTFYMLSGLALLVGMGWHLGTIEAVGCVGLATGLIVRAIAILAAFGPHLGPLATLVFFLFAAGACIERLRQIMRGEHIVIVQLPEDKVRHGDES